MLVIENVVGEKGENKGNSGVIGDYWTATRREWHWPDGPETYLGIGGKTRQSVRKSVGREYN